MSRHINMPSLCREKPLTPFLTFGTWPQEGRSILRWTFERPIATTGSPLLHPPPRRRGRGKRWGLERFERLQHLERLERIKGES